MDVRQRQHAWQRSSALRASEPEIHHSILFISIIKLTESHVLKTSTLPLTVLCQQLPQSSS